MQHGVIYLGPQRGRRYSRSCRANEAPRYYSCPTASRDVCLVPESRLSLLGSSAWAFVLVECMARDLSLPRHTYTSLDWTKHEDNKYSHNNVSSTTEQVVSDGAEHLARSPVERYWPTNVVPQPSCGRVTLGLALAHLPAYPPAKSCQDILRIRSVHMNEALRSTMASSNSLKILFPSVIPLGSFLIILSVFCEQLIISFL